MSEYGVHRGGQVVITAPAVVDGLRDRVDAGVAWLDQHHPGWADRIDVDVLDLGDCYSCVLGQVLGDFWTASITYDQAAVMGFEVTSVPDYSREQAALERLWRDVIEQRQVAR